MTRTKYVPPTFVVCARCKTERPDRPGYGNRQGWVVGMRHVIELNLWFCDSAAPVSTCETIYREIGDKTVLRWPLYGAASK